MKKLFISYAVVLLLASSQALDNGLGLTPQMGWNTWNKFGCNINENLIKQSADKIVELGLDKLGYTYVNLDDCWMAKDRDASGHWVADPTNFPSGMKSLGEYIHSKGLKYGLYSSAGVLTCQGKAASLYNEEVDAQDLAKWEVDYLKYDNCYNQDVPAVERYTRMRDALLKTGRPIFYSICNWGIDNPWEWGAEIGNSWRTTEDISPKWKDVFRNFRKNSEHDAFAKPGGWNDPDMLEVGNGLSEVEEQSHFALWAITKAPLILGCDLDKISQSSLAIISNKELIDINQDSLGIQGSCKLNCGRLDWDLLRLQVYTSPLSNGDIAVVIINWSPLTRSNVSIKLQDIGIPEGSYIARDLWKHEDLGIKNEKIEINSIHGLGNVALRLRKSEEEKEFLTL